MATGATPDARGFTRRGSGILAVVAGRAGRLDRRPARGDARAMPASDHVPLMGREARAGRARLLFVCLGNICRSPMAQAVLRHLAREAGLDERIEVDSAGTRP